ncbi:MAG: cytochrome c [Deltaproteobacteria bacterium]|nr:MAG: cytochrome c [Deltaproteobacteria bacterium]
MKTVATALVLLLLGIAASAWAQGDAAKGKAIVEKKKCAVCHKAGSKEGKPMEELAGTHNDAHLKGSITDPKKFIKPDIKMPAAKLSDQELQDVIAYLRSIAKK